MSNDGAGLGALGVQMGSAGRAIGTRLLDSVFVPYGKGMIFDSNDGRFWQLRLAQNADGTLYVGEDGKPTIELIEVAI
jgi:hypothetical protein